MPAERYTCPVCGYPDLSELPRSDQGGGSYEICSSCGFEFGVSDDDRGYTYDAWRELWIDQGMCWWSNSTAPPSGWNPEEQLQRLLADGA